MFIQSKLFFFPPHRPCPPLHAFRHLYLLWSLELEARCVLMFCRITVTDTFVVNCPLCVCVCNSCGFIGQQMTDHCVFSSWIQAIISSLSLSFGGFFSFFLVKRTRWDTSGDTTLHTSPFIMFSRPCIHWNVLEYFSVPLYTGEKTVGYCRRPRRMAVTRTGNVPQ